MDYNHVIQRIGEVVDAAGVVVIVAGAVIATSGAAIRLAHREHGTYRRFRQQLGQTILLGLVPQRHFVIFGGTRVNSAATA
jgi:uncharacterized membrane protein